MVAIAVAKGEGLYSGHGVAPAADLSRYHCEGPAAVSAIADPRWRYHSKAVLSASVSAMFSAKPAKGAADELVRAHFGKRVKGVLEEKGILDSIFLVHLVTIIAELSAGRRSTLGPRPGQHKVHVRLDDDAVAEMRIGLQHLLTGTPTRIRRSKGMSEALRRVSEGEGVEESPPPQTQASLWCAALVAGSASQGGWDKGSLRRSCAGVFP